MRARMPKSFLTFEQGDLVVATIIFAEQTAAKKRPALVISSFAHNAISDDVVLLKITSKENKSKGLVSLSPESVIGGRLKLESFIAVDNPVTVYKGIIESKIGRVSDSKLSEVKSRFAEIFGISSMPVGGKN